jgi:cytidylate kinase
MTNIESLIERQIIKWEVEKRLREEQKRPPDKEILPIVTVSRQRGSSGSFIARRLSEQLGYELADRQVIDIICKNSGFRRRIVETLDEKSRSQLEVWLDGLFHKEYVDSSDYFRALHHTIVALARHGGIVVLGRGGNFVLTLKTGFHLRVVAPESVRVDRLVKFGNLSSDEARDAIRRSDTERASFIKGSFKYDIDNPIYYDLVLNTGLIDVEAAISLAADAARLKFNSLREAR